MPESTKRLFISFAGAGDMVILIPLFRKLSESGPLDILMRPYGIPLFKDQNFIGKTFALNHPNRGKSGLKKLLMGGHRRKLGAILAQENYDEVIVYEQERPVIKEWIETWRAKGSAFPIMTYPELASDRVATGAKSLGLDPDTLESAPRMDVSEDGRKTASLRLQKLGNRVIAVQPGAGHNKKQARQRALPSKTWAELLTRILRNDDADAVVLHGSIDQSNSSEEIIMAMPTDLRPKLHNWCGKANLTELTPILAESAALISVNTGPAHMAAAVGTPLLIVMGPASPESYLPKGIGPVEYVSAGIECQHCMGTPMLKKCKDYRCMKMVTPDMLLEAWSKIKRRENA